MMHSNSKELDASEYTFVVEYEKGKEPAVSGATEILGGRLVYVAFEGIRYNQLTPEEASVLSDFIGSDGDRFFEYCDNYDINPDDVIEKLRGAI